MTEINERTDQRPEQATAEVEVSADRKPTAPEVLEWRRDDVFSPRPTRTQRSFRPCGTSQPDSSSAVWSARSSRLFLGPDGKSHSQTFQTTRDAAAWLGQQRADISRKTWDSKSTPVVTTFGAYATRWLTERKVKGRPLAARTISNYRDLVARFILKTFARQPIHLITRDEVEKWYDRTAVNSPTYRARAYSLLRSILASAVDDGYLPVNPARIRGAGQAKRRHKVQPAMLAELQVLTEAMPPRYRLMVQLAAWCALRVR
jgi:hypothetical protein